MRDVEIFNQLRFVQLAVASDAENGEALYGLTADGQVYVYQQETKPRSYQQDFADRDGKSLCYEPLPPGLNVSPSWATKVGQLVATSKVFPGCSEGWSPLKMIRSRVVMPGEEQS